MSNKPACPRCHHQGFWKSKCWTGRPLFICDSCGHRWTNGDSGEPYTGFEMGYKPVSVQMLNLEVE